MDALAQILTSGMLTGAQYAMSGLGLALIVRSARFLNLLHGTFFALGAYAAFEATQAGLVSLAGAVPAAAAGALGGMLAETTVVRRAAARPFAAAPALLGMAVLAEAAFAAVWGPSSRSVPLRFAALRIGHVVVSTEQIIAAAVAFACFGAIAVVRRTRLGIMLRAAAEEPEVAAASGLNLPRIRTAVFGAGCGMAAVAGALLSPLLSVSPAMGRTPLIVSLAIVMLGGPRHPAGILAAGLALGLAAEAVGYTLSGTWASVLGLAVAIVFAAVRFDPAWMETSA